MRKKAKKDSMAFDWHGELRIENQKRFQEKLSNEYLDIIPDPTKG